MAPNVVRWGIADGFRLARTVGRELRNRLSYSAEEFVDAAERALLRSPNEWVIHYSLADKYQELGLYESSLKAAQRCVELKPSDIRSAYALATTYSILTRASWTEKEEEAAKLLALLIGNAGRADRRYSQAGLDRIGLAIDTAAAQAIRWFEKCLTLHPDSESRTMIQMSLTTLYESFPHLRR